MRGWLAGALMLVAGTAHAELSLDDLKQCQLYQGFGASKTGYQLRIQNGTLSTRTSFINAEGRSDFGLFRPVATSTFDGKDGVEILASDGVLWLLKGGARSLAGTIGVKGSAGDPVTLPCWNRR